MRVTRLLLLLSYAAVAVCGFIFLFAPSTSVAALVRTPQLILIWSAFFVVGGITALASLVKRIFHPGLVAWQWFEIAGASLASVAGLIYAYSVFEIASRFDAPATWGTGAFIFGFSCLLGARAVDLYTLIKSNDNLLKKLQNEHLP